MNPDPGPLVLIEPYAHQGGGHHQRTLAALASVRPDSLVIAPGGLSDDLGPLVRSSTRVTIGPAGPAARSFWPPRGRQHGSPPPAGRS